MPPRRAAAHDALLRTLRERFDAHPERHDGVRWDDVVTRLTATPAALATLAAMEETGGEPDVIGRDARGVITFCDCAAESPAGRRSLCFDRPALDARKENKPKGSALEMAATIGITLLDESAYRHLQTLGLFDRKTSSWIQTPPAIRKLGGALFGDRRYDHVFTYHNGAESYYAARGFRGLLRV
ncbi:MAG: DUF4256 domain-containing protein [Gemmatimonadaceae bacterium]|nr:DUF4256 domain-containing protein [Gemmatimonadaceae bacterium]